MSRLKRGDQALVWRNVVPWGGCNEHFIGHVVEVDQQVLLELWIWPKPQDDLTPGRRWLGAAWTTRQTLFCPGCKRLVSSLPAANLVRLPEPDDVSRHDRLEELEDSIARQERELARRGVFS